MSAGNSFRVSLLRVRSLLGSALAVLFAVAPLLSQEPTKDAAAQEAKPAAQQTSTTAPAAAPAMDPQLVKIFAGSNPTGIADLKLMQDHIRKLSAKLQAATVGVQVGPAQGSGVIINKEGIVMTAAHVSGRAKLTVHFQLADGRKFTGDTLGLNRTTDGGLMKIKDGKDLPYLEMGDSSNLREGQWVLAMGHPGGYQSDRQPVLRLGRLLLVERTVLTTDCTLVGGDSGGPLFDMEGKVIGINSRIASEIKANMHVPVNTFKDDWNRMMKSEAWGNFPGQEPYLGVRGEKDARDAKIAHVFPNSPAERAGFKVGDVVEEFDGKKITDFSSLSALVQEHSPGDKIKVIIHRGDEQMELELTIGKKGE